MVQNKLQDEDRTVWEVAISPPLKIKRRVGCQVTDTKLDPVIITSVSPYSRVISTGYSAPGASIKAVLAFQLF